MGCLYSRFWMNLVYAKGHLILNRPQTSSCCLWLKLNALFCVFDSWEYYWIAGYSAHVMTFEVGRVLEDARWQAPVYCFEETGEKKSPLVESVANVGLHGRLMRGVMNTTSSLWVVCISRNFSFTVHSESSLNHSLREGNNGLDKLARTGVDQEDKMVSLVAPPDKIIPLEPVCFSVVPHQYSWINATCVYNLIHWLLVLSS